MIDTCVGSPPDLIGDNHFIGGVCNPSFLGHALDILMKSRPGFDSRRDDWRSTIWQSKRVEPDRQNWRVLHSRAGSIYSALGFLMKVEQCFAVCHR
jgi:hypothetical protein